MTKKAESATPKSTRGLRMLRKNAKLLLLDTAKLRKKHLTSLKDPDAILLESATNRLNGLIQRKDLSIEDISELEKAVESLDGLVAEFLGFARKSAIREYIESILYAVLIALTIRTALVEPFKIPTGSMIPTLEINDHIFVSKFIYGIRIPFTGGFRVLSFNDVERGDVIVFENPGEGEDKGKDFIKRVVAIAGDKVRMNDNGLVLNGEPVETLDAGIGSCADTSGRECAFQEETTENSTYKTQHVIPATYNVVKGETLGGIAAKVGLSHEELIELNSTRLQQASLTGPDRFTRPLADGLRLQIRSPRRWNFGNSPLWPMPKPACPLATQTAPCYGAEALGNPAFPDVEVPEGHVLTFGDNRDNSRDGRFWGFVPVDNVKGKAFVIWYAEDTERIFSLIP